jgi:hypothetical protein
VKLEFTQPVVPQPEVTPLKQAPEDEPKGDHIVRPGWMATIEGVSVAAGTGILAPGIVFPPGVVRAVASSATGAFAELNSSAHA